jgi:hypothetical protein
VDNRRFSHVLDLLPLIVVLALVVAFVLGWPPGS